MRRVLAVCALLCLALCVSRADADGAFVWRGFNHTWERTLAGFETPHRIGGFSNNIQHEEHSALLSTAQGSVQFVPGVDGDYAFPQILYSAFYSPSVHVVHDEAVFRWTDNSTHSSDPEARSSL